MSDYKKQLEELKSKREKQVTEEAKKKERLEMYNKELDETIKEINELSLNPDNLEELIASLEKEIQKDLQNAE